MVLSTSYKTFKLLELLRRLCGLTAREVSQLFMGTSESTYSVLRSNLTGGGSALSTDVDRSVQVALAVVDYGLASKLLPVVTHQHDEVIEELVRYRNDLISRLDETRAELGITQDDLSIPLKDLAAHAKFASAGLRKT